MKTISSLAINIMRYSIVVLLFWYGIIKFSNAESEALKTIVRDSKVLNYVYKIYSPRAISSMIGLIEIVTAILIALHPFSNKIGKVGSALGMLIFANTLFFLFSTQNIWKVQQGMLLPVSFGSFILKDLLCFGFCLFELSGGINKKNKMPIMKK